MIDETQKPRIEHSDPLEPESVSTEYPQIGSEAVYQEQLTRILEPGTVKNIEDQDGNVHTIGVDLDGTIHHVFVHKDGTHETEHGANMIFDFDPETKTILMRVPEDENDQEKPSNHETAKRIFKGVAISGGVVFALSALIWGAKKSKYHSRPNE